MVIKNEAQCDGKKWFDKKRCKSFITCDYPHCDLKDLPYMTGAIKDRIDDERKALKILILDKKKAKRIRDNCQVDLINQDMTDKAVGVLILQQALVDLGVGGSVTMLDYIKAKREVKKWKNQLKK